MITPDGPGHLVSVSGDFALVATEAAGTRVFNRSEIYRPGHPDAPLIDPAELSKRQQNDADAAQASTPAGINLRYPYQRRLRDLNLEAGHGTIVENAIVNWDGDIQEPGEVVGWVRARIGDDGKRYWWGQDAHGGPPDDMPFHENLPAKAGLPAIRAAGTVRTDRKPRSLGARRIITPPYATREIKLTTAQVAQLRTLTLVGTYPDGDELPTPPWVGGHRRYVMSVAQMQALRLAAEAAADTSDTTTTHGRRSRKVLLNAADKLHFEEYETARRGATIPRSESRTHTQGPTHQGHPAPNPTPLYEPHPARTPSPTRPPTTRRHPPPAPSGQPTSPTSHPTPRPHRPLTETLALGPCSPRSHHRTASSTTPCDT